MKFLLLLPLALQPFVVFGFFNQFRIPCSMSFLSSYSHSSPHTHTHTHIIQPSYSWCNYEITTTNNTLSNQSTSILIIASLFYLFLRSVEVDTLPTSSKDICSNEIINKPKLNNHSPRKT